MFPKQTLASLEHTDQNFWTIVHEKQSDINARMGEKNDWLLAGEAYIRGTMRAATLSDKEKTYE